MFPGLLIQNVHVNKLRGLVLIWDVHCITRLPGNGRAAFRASSPLIGPSTSDGLYLLVSIQHRVVTVSRTFASV